MARRAPMARRGAVLNRIRVRPITKSWTWMQSRSAARWWGGLTVIAVITGIAVLVLAGVVGYVRAGQRDRALAEGVQRRRPKADVSRRRVTQRPLSTPCSRNSIPAATNSIASRRRSSALRAAADAERYETQTQAEQELVQAVADAERRLDKSSAEAEIQREIAAAQAIRERDQAAAQGRRASAYDAREVLEQIDATLAVFCPRQRHHRGERAGHAAGRRGRRARPRGRRAQRQPRAARDDELCRGGDARDLRRRRPDAAAGAQRRHRGGSRRRARPRFRGRRPGGRSVGERRRRRGRARAHPHRQCERPERQGRRVDRRDECDAEPPSTKRLGRIDNTVAAQRTATEDGQATLAAATERLARIAERRPAPRVALNVQVLARSLESREHRAPIETVRPT